MFGQHIQAFKAFKVFKVVGNFVYLWLILVLLYTKTYEIYNTNIALIKKNKSQRYIKNIDAYILMLSLPEYTKKYK